MESREPIRIDKWLWAARFFKTRSLAADAAEGGKVHLNGVRTKPGHAIRIGDEVKIRHGSYEWIVIVQNLSERRGPGAEAQKLYEESEASKKTREALIVQLRLQGYLGLGFTGRPTKKDRREIRDLKRRW